MFDSNLELYLVVFFKCVKHKNVGNMKAAKAERNSYNGEIPDGYTNKKQSHQLAKTNKHLARANEIRKENIFFYI